MRDLQDRVVELLGQIPPHPHWVVILPLVLVAGLLYSARARIVKGLRPGLIAFEYINSPKEATETLAAWGPARIKIVRRAILVDSFLVPLYAALSAYLCIWAAVSVQQTVPWLTITYALMGVAVLTAVLFGWLENAAMLTTLVRGRGGRAVFVSWFGASVKYWLLAVAAALLLFRLEYFMYESLQGRVSGFPAYWITLLIVLTALVGVWKLRFTAALHPSLFSLQVAPSVKAANRVLARWGAVRRQKAIKANGADGLFAAVYATTLAVISFQIAAWVNDDPFLASISRAVGWYMLLAGTLHLAQNFGTHAALADNRMGWWIRICRTCGRLRVLLLFAGGLWFGLLLLRWETQIAGKLLVFVRDLAMEGWPVS